MSRDESDNITLNIERAGDQFCLSMSMHIFPLSEIWQVIELVVAALKVVYTHIHVVYPIDHFTVSEQVLPSPLEGEQTHLVVNTTFGAENLKQISIPLVLLAYGSNLVRRKTHG